MPLLSHQCPRCTHDLEIIPISVARGGGGYRELADFAATGHRCTRCGLGVVSGLVVDELMKRVPVGGGMSERDRKPTRLGCPHCMGNVDAVLLSWGTSFVEIEQCPRCRTMLLDAAQGLPHRARHQALIGSPDRDRSSLGQVARARQHCFTYRGVPRGVVTSGSDSLRIRGIPPVRATGLLHARNDLPR